IDDREVRVPFSLELSCIQLQRRTGKLFNFQCIAIYSYFMRLYFTFDSDIEMPGASRLTRYFRWLDSDYHCSLVLDFGNELNLLRRKSHPFPWQPFHIYSKMVYRTSKHLYIHVESHHVTWRDNQFFRRYNGAHIPFAGNNQVFDDTFD